MPESKTLIDEFNEFFSGDAAIAVTDDQLIVTIGTRAMTISLPCAIGWDSTPPLPRAASDTNRQK